MKQMIKMFFSVCLVFLAGFFTCVTCAQAATYKLISETTYGGHTYQLIELTKSKVNWYQACDWAGDYSSDDVSWYLATITSEEENAAVESLSTGLSGKYAINAWTGANQEDNSSAADTGWAWLDSDEEWEYTNWYTNEPSDGKTVEENNEQNALTFLYNSYSSSRNGKWDDYAYNSKLAYIVLETSSDSTSNASSVPVPSTILLLGTGVAGLAAVRRKNQGVSLG